MKKTLILALALTMVASLSFAANARFVQPNATFTTGSPATTNNDDTCDIAVVPAATLLLPNFEVDFANGPGGGPNTNFSITNTSNIPQIAHVTIWTDWSFPVLDFNIFLTGYDVQPVSLYNIIGRGELPATTATASRGALSAANPNLSWSTAAVGACTGLPASLPGFLVAEIQGALTEGTYFDCLGQVGSDDHGANAVGYVTIDVANTCSQSLPTDPAYYSQEILYDNTLIGEYYRIDPRATTGNFAGGNPMVHIRAIPEGGVAGAAAIVNFPFTFYDRYTLGNLADAANKIDRRQPLPSNFAARFIYTDTDFQTSYAIWREGELGGADTIVCLDLTGNAYIPIADIVRFDEHENPTFFPGGGCQYSPCTTPEFTLPETSAHSVNDSTVFPPDYPGTADAGGWMYLNLSHNQSDPTIVPDYSVVRQTGGTHAGRSQNWVIVQMTAFGRYGVDFNAAYLENGCSVLRPDVVDAVQEVINWGATGNVTP